MARKKGSRDLRPRKAARRKPKPPARAVEHQETRHETQTAVETTPIAAETVSEFDAAVASVLGDDSLSRGSPSPTPGSASPGQQSGSPAAIADEESFIGRDAWEAIIQAPFRSLALWMGIPAFDQLGKVRAKMLATPSYPLYRHYVKAWLTDNPDDELFVAKVMTGAVLVTVLQEMWLIYSQEMATRRATSPEASATVRVDQLHTDN